MKTSKLVEKILGYSIPSRNSDKELIIRFLMEEGAELSQWQIDLIRSISFESIRRTRQKLQQNGQYLPSPEVAKQRRLKGYIATQNAPSATAERMAKIIEEQPWNPANARPGYLQEQMEAQKASTEYSDALQKLQQPKAISWEADDD